VWSRSSRSGEAETIASIAAIRESLRGVCGCLCGHGFIRGRRGVSDSQNASIGCLILIQSKPLIRNKILTPLYNHRSSNYVLNMHLHCSWRLVVLNEVGRI